MIQCLYSFIKVIPQKRPNIVKDNSGYGEVRHLPDVAVKECSFMECPWSAATTTYRSLHNAELQCCHFHAAGKPVNGRIYEHGRVCGKRVDGSAGTFKQ